MLLLPLQVIDRHVTPAGGEASFTFSSIDDLIPAGARHLVLIFNAATIGAGDYGDLSLRPNADATADKGHQRIQGVGAGTASAVSNGATSWLCSRILAGPNFADAYGGGVLLIPHAFNTTNHKVALLLAGAVEHAVNASAFHWPHTDAITSLFIYGITDFIAGSIFTLAIIDEQYNISEEILDGADGSFTVDNIRQGEGDLLTIGYLRSDQAAVEDEVLHTINDDAVAANYPAQELTGRAAVAAAASPVNQEIGMVSGVNALANDFGALVATYPQFGRGYQPHFLSISGYYESTGPTSEIRAMSGRRDFVEPINKLHYEPNAGTDFKDGSGLWMYRVPKRLIDRQVLTADQARITFANIPQYYEALIIHIWARSTTGEVDDTCAIEINNDAGPVTYDSQRLAASGAAVVALRSASSPNISTVPGSTDPARSFGGGTLFIPQYNRTDGHKHIVVFDGDAEDILQFYSFRWENTDAITQIELYLTDVGAQEFVAGSVFELEGVLRKEGLPADAGMIIGV